MMTDATLPVTVRCPVRGQAVVVNVWGSVVRPCRRGRCARKVFMPQRKTRVLRFGSICATTGSRRDFIADREVAYPSIYDFAGATLAA